jgi:adenylosuccinate lyase
MLQRMNRVIDTLFVYEETMLKNINHTNGVIFSQRVLNLLIENNYSREDAYDLVQPLSLQAYNEDVSFKQLLLELNLDVFTEDILEELFDVKYYLNKVDDIFSRFEDNILKVN